MAELLQACSKHIDKSKVAAPDKQVMGCRFGMLIPDQWCEKNEHATPPCSSVHQCAHGADNPESIPQQSIRPSDSTTHSFHARSTVAIFSPAKISMPPAVRLMHLRTKGEMATRLDL